MTSEKQAPDQTEARLAKFRHFAATRFSINIRDALVFFITYGRYESSAKALKWIQNPQKNKELRVCTKTVAGMTEEGFMKLVEVEPLLQAAVEYFTACPPNKQAWGDDRAEWKPMRQTEKGMLRLLLNLRQARNNLFHGGKGWSELDCRERDQAVVSHGLTILCALVASHPDLEEKFNAYW